MAQFLSENWGDLLVLAAVLAAAAGAAWNVHRRKSSGCGCGCDGCPSKGICHPEK